LCLLRLLLLLRGFSLLPGGGGLPKRFHEKLCHHRTLRRPLKTHPFIMGVWNQEIR
jgi:hypothetical protein